MRRADRLFEIIQRLRRHRVVTARSLAEQFNLSERTIYRDIRDLTASKVPIEGAAGVGYSLRKGYDLPPLMFSERELEALVFGPHGAELERRRARSRGRCGTIQDRKCPAGSPAAAIGRSIAMGSLRHAPGAGDIRSRSIASSDSRLPESSVPLLRRERRCDAPQGPSPEPLVLSAILDRRILVRIAE